MRAFTPRAIGVIVLFPLATGSRTHVRYHRGMIRWTWTQTAKGNWICLSGSYTAVAEWQGTWWEIRVKTKGGISSTTHRATSPAELESFMQRLIQDLAKQAREMQLLDSGPARLGWM